MKALRRKILLSLLLISFSFILYSCGNSKVDNLDGDKVYEVKEVNLNNGAVIIGENGKYKNYDLKGNRFSPLGIDEVIVEYNKESGNYVFLKEGKHFVKYKNTVIPIEDENYNFLKLSDDGEYLAYMINDDGYNLKVLDLKNKKTENIKSNVAISGNLFDFINGDTLIYYGISEEKINGVFSYNIKEKKENLVYKLDGGYGEYIKGLDNSFILFRKKLDNSSVLEKIDLNGNEKILSEELYSIKDIIEKENKYYLLGEFIDDNKSLYELDSNGNYNRLVYDFPKLIDMDKGIEIDENGSILFVGMNLYEEKSIFSYDKDGDVKLLLDGKEDYTFVKIN